MKLTRYLARKRISLDDFAEQTGIDRSTLYRYIKGDRWPSLRAAIKLLAATGGKVTPNDFLPEDKS